MSVPIKHFTEFYVHMYDVDGGYIGKYVLWRNTLSSDESFEMREKKEKKKKTTTLNALDGICVILRVEWYLCLEFYIRFIAKCIYQLLIGFFMMNKSFEISSFKWFQERYCINFSSRQSERFINHMLWSAK